MKHINKELEIELHKALDTNKANDIIYVFMFLLFHLTKTSRIMILFPII
jgi:hypothetical protein